MTDVADDASASATNAVLMNNLKVISISRLPGKRFMSREPTPVDPHPSPAEVAAAGHTAS